MQIEVRYSEEYVKTRFVRDGVEQAREEELEAPIAELSAEAREALLEIRAARGRNMSRLGRGYYSKAPEFKLDKRPEAPEDFEEFIFRFRDANREYLASVRESENEKLREIARNLEEIDSEETISTPVRRSAPQWGEHPSKYDNADPELREETKKLRERVEARWDREQRAERKAREEAKEAEKKRLHDEKLAFCREHGSEHLREAVEAGYNCQRMYVLERAAHEFPEYTVDFENEADWSDRACPSAPALREAKRVAGTVVWLTSPAVAEKREMDEEEYYAETRYEEDFGSSYPCEAVVIQSYLGKYDLVREV